MHAHLRKSLSYLAYKQLCQVKRRAASFLLVSTYILQACSFIEPEIQDVETVEPAPLPEPVAEVINDRPFDPDTLYALMVAEFAGERKRFDVMLNNYVQQAQTTQDPGVVARASRVARFLKARGPSLDMALLWSELEEDNLEAHYHAAAELVNANRLLEAFEHSKSLLSEADLSGMDAIGAQALKGGDIQTTQTLIPKYRALITDHPQREELQVGLSFLLQHAGDNEGAIEAIRQAKAIKPDNMQIAMQEYQLLEGAGRAEEARDVLQALVETHPNNVRLRLRLARSMLSTDIELAEQEFKTLSQNHPDDMDMLMTLALVQYERGKLDEASQKLQTLLSVPRRSDTAHYYLGKIALVKGQEDKALSHFEAVKIGSDYLPALAQLTELLARQGELAEALKVIAERKQLLSSSEHTETKLGLITLESHLYSSSGQMAEAITALNAGLRQYPENLQLLYSRAMLYTRLSDVPQAEADFLAILALKPNHAAALNALGYTLAVETDRLQEASNYVAKAYELDPDNPAIVDSMGWIAYLRGDSTLALSKLRRAMDMMPDHEIAAHLGEVLWATGSQEEARSTWQKGLQLKPDSSIIKETLERLDIQLR